MFVKGKARLGKLVHKKTATCLCLTTVNDNDKNDLATTLTKALANFNNNDDLLKESENILGHKSR